MAAVGIHHVDLAVTDVERSLQFYLGLLGDVGMHERWRHDTYRGTEEVVYLRFANDYLGLRPADGGEYRYYDVGIEHLAFYVDTREEVDAAYQRALELGARVQFPPEESRTVPDYYELFVFDPDGIRVEVACGPVDDEVS